MTIDEVFSKMLLLFGRFCLAHGEKLDGYVSPALEKFGYSVISMLLMFCHGLGFHAVFIMVQV